MYKKVLAQNSKDDVLMNIKMNAFAHIRLDPQMDATELMQSIRHYFASIEQRQHEFYIASALETVHFDGSFESFQRLDHMFAAYRRQKGLLSANLMQDPIKSHTLLLIASHIGAFISKKLGIAERWQNNHQVKNPERDNHLYSHDALHAYSLNCNNHMIFPIQLVLKHFCEEKLNFSISEEIESIILNYQIMHADDTGRHSEEMHAIQYIYQHDYALFCGQPYQKLVKMSRLDYSLQSLERFDDLMREIRQHHIHDIDYFIEQPVNIYFILFLSGYLGRVIAEEARGSLEWHNREQASKIFKMDLPANFAHSRIAQINQTMLKITQHICDFLFSPTIQRTSKKYATTKLNQICATHFPLYLAEDTRLKNTKFRTSPYCATFYQAGLLMGYLLQQLHGVMPPYSSKEILIPTSYPVGTTTFQHLEGIEKALKQFEQNLEQYPYNTLGYKTAACLPHLRCDAIAIDMISSGKFPVRLHLTVPYISSFDYRGFHILQPYFCAKDSKTQQQMDKIQQSMGAFFDGIQAFEAAYPKGIRNWQNYYRPNKFPYPHSMYKSEKIAYL